MTKEEKANELSKRGFKDFNNPYTRVTVTHIKDCCLEMAQWKDEQFDKKLQEIVDYVYPLICGGERLHINEIIGKDMVWKH